MISREIIPSRTLIASPDDPILVTGSGGFIGSRVVRSLLGYGFRNITCLIRPGGNSSRLGDVLKKYPDAHVRVVEGNLLSRRDCAVATRDARLIYHLAAGMEKTFAGCFLNSVVTTRNLL